MELSTNEKIGIGVGIGAAAGVGLLAWYFISKKSGAATQTAAVQITADATPSETQGRPVVEIITTSDPYENEKEQIRAEARLAAQHAHGFAQKASIEILNAAEKAPQSAKDAASAAANDANVADDDLLATEAAATVSAARAYADRVVVHYNDAKAHYNSTLTELKAVGVVTSTDRPSMAY